MTMEWSVWVSALQQIALADGCLLENVCPEAFRDFYDEGYTPRDAWEEDCGP